MNDSSIRGSVDRAVQAIGGRRRLLAAGLAGLAVLAALQALRPPAPPTTAVWAAARDLSGGLPITAGDLRRVALPRADVPAGAIPAATSVAGRLLAAPVRRGEPLTDVRLLGPSLLAALPRPGLVAVPVRVVDGPAAAALVHPGDVVDVLAVTGDSGGPATTVARGVDVVAVPARAEADAGADGGGLVIVAATPGQAAALARSAGQTRLSLALERP